MKTLGTDISIDVCKAEGYTMIQFDARRKFNKQKNYRIFNYYPEYCEGLNNEISTDIYYCFDELEYLYNKNKQSIDSFAETNKCVNFETPNYYDFLNLASDLIAYQGL